jgi:predicted DNA-binding transcriptional regulator AlpA
MIRYIRFSDLQARGIVNSRPSHRIEHFGFPPGRLIGPNTRAWTEAEVEEWLARQPTACKPGHRRWRRAEEQVTGAPERAKPGAAGRAA